MDREDELALLRIERHIDAIEKEVREMRHSLRVYKQDPGKYRPQLNNLAQAANVARRSAEHILRVLLKE